MVKQKEGTKTIRLTIYFETCANGVRLPSKQAFKRGTVYMPINHEHGIRTKDGGREFFGPSQNRLIDAIKKCLKNNEINFVDDKKIIDYKKYLKIEKEKEFFDQEVDL